MALALLTFVTTLVVMLGLYWAFVVRPEQQRSRDLVRRVQRGDAPAASDTSVMTPVTRSSVADALLASRITLGARLQVLLAESDLRWTVSGFMVRTAVAGAIGAVNGMIGLKHPAAALLGLVTAALPYAYVRRKRETRLREFEEQFPEAIDLIARSLRAGHTFTAGLGIAAEEIPAPVGLEFRRVHDEQNFGMALPDALRAMARRVPVLDARFFVTAVLTQREAGGNLAEVLDNLSAVMRDRFKVKRQIRVVSAHGRITAWVLTLLPPALATVLFLVSPDSMRILVDDPLGLRIVGFALLLQIVGTFVISKLVQVEY